MYRTEEELTTVQPLQTCGDNDRYWSHTQIHTTEVLTVVLAHSLQIKCKIWLRIMTKRRQSTELNFTLIMYMKLVIPRLCIFRCPQEELGGTEFSIANLNTALK